DIYAVLKQTELRRQRHNPFWKRRIEQSNKDGVSKCRFDKTADRLAVLDPPHRTNTQDGSSKCRLDCNRQRRHKGVPSCLLQQQTGRNSKNSLETLDSSRICLHFEFKNLVKTMYNHR